MSTLSRRAFMGASAATIASLMVPGGRAFAQAVPVWNATPAITTGGRMVVSSVTLNGSTTALSIGDRTILSRAATQIAASGATRAVANRTMGLIATRVLSAAATAGPWGLAAAGLGLVAYGAYRYLTADQANAGATGQAYSVLFDQSGAAQLRAAIDNGCSGLAPNGGTYPNSIALGALNAANPPSCSPMFRQKVVWHGANASSFPTPSGWFADYRYNNGYTNQATGQIEWWIFLTRTFPAPTNGTYAPLEVPSPSPALVPASMPAAVQAQAPSPQILADLANGVWQQAVPGSDTAALPWSTTVGAQATQPVPKIKTGAETVAEPVPATIAQLATPRPAVIPNAEVGFTFPDNVVFPEDAPATNPTPTPGTSPTPSPTPTPSTGIDWGTPPEGAIPGAPAAFSWIPTPWAAPSLPGSCTGLPYDFTTVFRGVSGSINPCPVIDQARPVLRPVAVAGWTVYAVTQFLDL